MSIQTVAAVVCHHAETRCRQRGITTEMLSMVIDLHDTVVPRGDSRTAISISRKGKVRLQAAGHSAATLDRIANIAIVLSPGGEVITVIRNPRKWYRRTWH